MPLDGVAEAILLGLVTPFLWWLYPGYLRHRFVRALIVALVIAKARLIVPGPRRLVRAVRYGEAARE